MEHQVDQRLLGSMYRNVNNGTWSLSRDHSHGLWLILQKRMPCCAHCPLLHVSKVVLFFHDQNEVVSLLLSCKGSWEQTLFLIDLQPSRRCYPQPCCYGQSIRCPSVSNLLLQYDRQHVFVLFSKLTIKLSKMNICPQHSRNTVHQYVLTWYLKLISLI